MKDQAIFAWSFLVGREIYFSDIEIESFMVYKDDNNLIL